MHEPLVFVVPGDLHLTTAGQENHRAALGLVDEVNEMIRPDFVQFIGDNVQHAAEAEFALFHDVARRLRVPYRVLVGDHDVYEDPLAARFRRLVGETYGASSYKGFRCLRLNTLESQPLGISDAQLQWFRDEVETAARRGEPLVLFQHHYPFKVYEQYAGPGIDHWRQIVQSARVMAIFTGHTHYGQIANDGRNLSITTRSIGDPEGGAPGFSLVYLHGNDLAVIYRTIDDRGPIALITHPRDLILATGPEHIISGDDRLAVRVWAHSTVTTVAMRIDAGPWGACQGASSTDWTACLRGASLTKGRHVLEVMAQDDRGQQGLNQVTFLVDTSRRYTPVPRVYPEVTATAFC